MEWGPSSRLFHEDLSQSKDSVRNVQPWLSFIHYGFSFNFTLTEFQSNVVPSVNVKWSFSLTLTEVHSNVIPSVNVIWYFSFTLTEFQSNVALSVNVIC